MAETPSLGRAVVDLFDAAGMSSYLCRDVRTAPAEVLARAALVVVAANNDRCATLDARIRGEVPLADLIVIGSRDPRLPTAARTYPVELPLVPGPLLDLVRALSMRAEAPPGRAHLR